MKKRAHWALFFVCRLLLTLGWFRGFVVSMNAHKKARDCSRAFYDVLSLSYDPLKPDAH
jgi:hypothetical protein